jgi:hypothetical protein
MEFQIKEEPFEFNDSGLCNSNSDISNSNKSATSAFIQAQYNAERFYLDNFHSIFNEYNTEQLFMDSMEVVSSESDDINNLINKRNEFLITDALKMIQVSNSDSTKNKVKFKS